MKRANYQVLRLSILIRSEERMLPIDQQRDALNLYLSILIRSEERMLLVERLARGERG